MDKRTRGRIEKDLDKFLKSEESITKNTVWLLDALQIVRAPEEIILGYLFGALMSGYSRAVSYEKIKRNRKSTDMAEEERDEIRDMLRRRIPDFLERINRELGI